jgi:hypothetical protein
MPEVAERSVVEVLKAAKQRITPEEAWTTGMFAGDAEGMATPVGDAQACRWCAEGALATELLPGGVDQRQVPVRGLLRDYAAYKFLTEAAHPDTPVGVNDDGSHSEVLAMFDEAIQLAEQEATNG